MPITMLDAVEFSKIPSLQFVVPVVSADPTGYEAGLIYNSVEKALKYHNGSAWVAVGGGSSSGPAGGDLSGTYPNPQIAAGVIVDADVNGSANIAQSKIANLVADLAARQTTGTADTKYLPFSGGALTGFVTAHANPTTAMQLAPKQYVDMVAQGLDFKNSVKAATTANITLSGTQTVDGVSLLSTDRVLVKDQTAPEQNGIYTVAAGAWVRAVDADAVDEISVGTLVPVEGGTVNGNSLFLCTAIAGPGWNPGMIGSTWTRYGGVTAVTAGKGLILSGSALDVVGDANLSVGADLVSVLSAPKWTTPRSITLTGDVTGTAASVDGSANVSIATTVVSTAPKQYAGDVGAGTSVVINHALNTRDCSVEVYRATTPWDTVQCGVERTDVNNVTLKFASAVAANAFRVVVQGR